MRRVQPRGRRFGLDDEQGRRIGTIDAGGRLAYIAPAAPSAVCRRRLAMALPVPRAWWARIFLTLEAGYGMVLNRSRPWSKRLWRWPVAGLTVALLMLSAMAAALPPDPVRGLYLPGHCLSPRRLDTVIHYAGQTDLNAVIVHVKNPHGRLNFVSRQPLAPGKESVACDIAEATAARLKAAGMWSVAKLDVFIDTRLARAHPELGVHDGVNGGLWQDDNGLSWVNPYNRRVWDYNIGLAVELAEMGFDEIQFDYIRFPSDGNLSRIVYSGMPPGLSRAGCIGAFLAAARAALAPSGAVLSVDLFGLVAWKTDDFGVGQVLEQIAPHVDVICPMLYPSHFPVGFLGWREPGQHPEAIMRLSAERLRQRTGRPIRPWVQGFWYKPEQIQAQLAGLAAAGVDDWAIWHPSGRYNATYTALGQRLDRPLAPPRFYPVLAALRSLNARVVRGREHVVNLTDYRNGYSILSLEQAADGRAGPYNHLGGVVGTLDEAILDRVLSCRQIDFGPLTRTLAKVARVASLIGEDIGVPSRRMRPMPIYLPWADDCRFSITPPAAALDAYRAAGR